MRPLTRMLVGVVVVLGAHPAYAYRPFDSTDAAVAAKGEMELECGPLGYLVDADGRFLVVPSAILNLGIADGWEVVLEGRHFVLVHSVENGRHHSLRDTALSLKGVLRQGSLQDRPGPSVALEVGLLLPGVGVDPGVGAMVTGIVSQRWSAVMVHFNGALAITHDHTVGAVAGGIVEGPSRWAIRPVAEAVMEREVGRSVSALVGAIWHVRDNLSVDAGWRIARADGANIREFRAGFTWAFPLDARGGSRTGSSSGPLGSRSDEMRRSLQRS